jgi:hypothetical protein
MLIPRPRAELGHLVIMRAKHKQPMFSAPALGKVLDQLGTPSIFIMIESATRRKQAYGQSRLLLTTIQRSLLVVELVQFHSRCKRRASGKHWLVIITVAITGSRLVLRPDKVHYGQDVS